MRHKNNFTISIRTMVFIGVCCFASLIFAQHRGDNLNFQGMDLVNRNGVKAVAMGGAYTSISGELDAFFWNPAGLIGLSGFQVSANFKSNDRLWRESQDYRPNRQVVTMSFILDGLYRPNPEFNGWIDNEAFFEDSTYIVNEPLLGKNSYSEEAADWQKKLDDSGLNNFAAAFPFTVSGRPFVISAGLSRRLNVMNYDRNQTNLTPHPAFDGYNDLPGRVTGAEDSVRIVWSDYERQRTGPLHNFSAALSFGLNDNINFGISINRLSGNTDEFQTLNRIGNFDLVDGIQIFRFSYDTLNVQMTGTSDFSATNVSFGTILKLGKLSLGANLTPGYTITRDWKYTMKTATADSSGSESMSGKDEFKTPFSFNLGASINPHKNFRIAFDIEHRPYGNADFSITREDDVPRNWADQTSIRAGVEFKPIQSLSLLAGYRDIPQVFIPDGAADHERGPEAEYYTLGASLNVPFARLDFAYEIGKLRYYDSYFSNTNFAFERSKNLLFGITLMR